MSRAKQALLKNNDTGQRAVGLDALARREGEQTEQIYFNQLRTHYRLATVDVTIHNESIFVVRFRYSHMKFSALNNLELQRSNELS